LLDSSIIITITTVLMYVMVIGYNDGFYSFYEIYNIKYDINAQDIVSIMKPLLFYVYSYAFLCISILFLIYLFFKVHRHLIAPIIFTVLVGVSSLLAVRHSTTAAIMGIIMIGFFWILYIVLPILNFKEGKTITERLDLFEKDYTDMFTESSVTNPEFHKIMKRLFSVFVIIVIIYFVPATVYDLSYTIGKQQASLKDDYMRAVNYNNYILVYQDNSKCIFMPLKDESTLSREYIFAQNDSLDNLELKPYIINLSL
jgi:hypothetical protein